MGPQTFLCLGWQSAAEGTLFSGCPCAPACITKNWWMRYLTNRLWEFCQIYNLDVDGNKNELIRFWGQRVKGKGHGRHKVSVSTSRSQTVSRCCFGRLGFFSVSRKSGKVSVSVSYWTEKRRLQSRLGFGSQHLVLQAHFQRQQFTKLSIANRLSVCLYSTACRSRSLCFKLSTR